MRPLSALLLALVTDDQLSHQERRQLAVLVLQLLRRTSPPDLITTSVPRERTVFNLDVSEWVNDTKRKLEALQAHPSIELSDLFPPAFMAKHSTLSDFDAFARESGVDFSGGWDTVDADALDAAVRRLTSFESWHAMQQAGLAAWFDRQ